MNKDEEIITRDLFRYFLQCGLNPDDALEKLAFILAMEPAMFTRMVPILDDCKDMIREANYDQQIQGAGRMQNTAHQA